MPTNQVKLHPSNNCPHLGYASFSLLTAEAAAWSSHCLLLGPLPQLYFWHALFLCSAGMLLRRRGWSRRGSCRPSSHSCSWNIRTGILFCLSQLFPLISWSQLLKVVLRFKHPPQGFIPAVQLAAVSLVPSERSQTPCQSLKGLGVYLQHKKTCQNTSVLEIFGGTCPQNWTLD